LFFRNAFLTCIKPEPDKGALSTVFSVGFGWRLHLLSEKRTDRKNFGGRALHETLSRKDAKARFPADPLSFRQKGPAGGRVADEPAGPEASGEIGKRDAQNRQA
jgi:hypothetical protein